MTRLPFFFAAILLLALGYCSALSSTDATSKSGANDKSLLKKTTIAVCTGPDCRVDGASSCLRQFQRTVAGQPELKASLRVTGRACVGPCGDGPCVTISDGNEERVVEAQPSKTQIALVTPDLFGSNPKGWYQVRTPEQFQEIMGISSQAAGVEYDSSSTEPYVLSSTRPSFDRPRNERKVLQRFAQVLVLIGLYSYDEGEVGNLQYGIAFALFVASDFIMKENLWTLLFDRARKMMK